MFWSWVGDENCTKSLTKENDWVPEVDGNQYDSIDVTVTSKNGEERVWRNPKARKES